MKFLIWALLGYFIVSWILRDRKSGDSKPDSRRARNSGSESIVQCAHCGVHVPASEVIVAQTGLTFCCEDHRLQMKKIG
jgi:uncharacterized protein